ncbi:MAG: multicopper oxidase domain-containing protein [Rhodospirillales bacterium]
MWKSRSPAAIGRQRRRRCRCHSHRRQRTSPTPRVSLNEIEGPVAALLGTISGDHSIPQRWDDPATETPRAGATERWDIYNFTDDGHPLHLHQTQFRILGRQPMNAGAGRGAEAWERGPKDTVIAYPGEITRIAAPFDLEGQFVWHCHILEHEDNEMMRPLVVGPLPTRL